MSTPSGSCCSSGTERLASQLRSCGQGPTSCPACGAAGIAIEPRTLFHMIWPDQTGRLGDREFRFCEAAGCDTVYFSIDGEMVFVKADLRQRVGIKSTGDPLAPVCYCFGFTVGDLEVDVRASRTPSTTERIRELVIGRLCACEVRNPSGRCCLGEISRTVRRLKSEGG